MAASSLFGITEKINDWVAQETELFEQEKYGLGGMIEALRSLRSFLIDLDRKKDEAWIRDLDARMKDVAYDAEDVIETFLLQTSSSTSSASNVVKRCVCSPVKFQKIKSKITEISDRIARLSEDLERYGILKLVTGEEGLSSTEDERQKLRWYHRNIDGSNVVGLESAVEDLVSVLVGNTDSQVVSICGMNGLGKTTLAKKVYDHRVVREAFKGRAWVNVSFECRERKVWEEIMYGLGFLNAKGSKISDEVLAGKLYKFLKENKCLVVLDDIWRTEDWDSIKAVFPSKSETDSKILLTSRRYDVCLYADPEGYLYEMTPLTDEESWELFRRIAFPGRDFADHSLIMEKLGKVIVKKCYGLPIFIVLLGGILSTKSRVNEWEMVLNSLSSNLGDYFEAVLTLAYDDLPYNLKLCFLCLSHFPEDYEINVVKLIQLWVTEGLAPSGEDIAESYLVELVERGIIQVGERDANSKIKTIYIHYLTRDLCLSKATEENFMSILQKPPSSRPVVRLAIHEYIPITCFKNSNLRSLLFFSKIYPDRLISSSLRETANIYLTEGKEGISMLWQLFKLLREFQRILTYIFNNFKLLRVLDFEGAELYIEGEFLKDIGNLTRLRHLSLKSTTCLSKIPSSIGNLKWLQTLDLQMNEEFPVKIPDVICKMVMLMYLYLPVVCDSKTKLRLNTLVKLRTLVNFNSKNCYVEDLRFMTNLAKLGIVRYFYIDDFEVNSASNPPVIIASEHLRSLSISRPERIVPSYLESLLSTCVHISDLSLSVSIGESLPSCDKFSRQITFMSLSETKLNTDPMPTLETLPNLKVLELHRAFIGKILHCSTPGFPELDSLKLVANSNLEDWVVDEQPCMPKLRSLEIIGCESLKMLPVGLMNITTLEELKIEVMPKAFKDSLLKGDEFNKIKNVVIFQNCY